MHCPHKIVFYRRWLSVTCHTRADYMTKVPLSELLNPLRYSLCLRPGTPQHKIINRGGKAWHWVAKPYYKWKIRRELRLWHRERGAGDE